MTLKTLYNSDCHYLAVLKTLDNLGFSVIGCLLAAIQWIWKQIGEKKKKALTFSQILASFERIMETIQEMVYARGQEILAMF